MNRTLAAVAAAAMLASSLPTVGFADESSSSAASSTSASSESSVSSTASSASATTSTVSGERTGPAWQRPCDDLKGLRKAQCIVKHNPGKGNKKDRVERRTDDKALRLVSECKEKTGAEKIACVRRIGKGIKKEVRKAIKQRVQRTIRGKKVEASTSSASN